MSRSRNRADRRHQRDRVVARRQSIVEHVWMMPCLEPGRYHKWNLNCGSPRCHDAKYFGIKRKRRRGRNRSDSPAECRRLDRRIRE